MPDFKQQLMVDGDFLALTLSHEWALPPFDFQVTAPEQQVLNVTVYDTGIIIFEPVNLALSIVTKDIVLSSGLHGNETAPIELCGDLIQQLILGQIALKHRVMFIIGNPAAINLNQRFVEENLNSLFSGAYLLNEGIINFERKRAKVLEGALFAFYRHANHANNTINTHATVKANLADNTSGVINQQISNRYHYDLHAAIRASKYPKFAICPFLHGAVCPPQQLDLLNYSGIDAVLFANAPTATFSYFSSVQFHANSFTVELGKAKAFGENDLADVAGFSQLLRGLLSNTEFVIPSLVATPTNTLKLFEISRRLDKQSANFSFHFADDIANFTAFKKGTKLATDGDGVFISADDEEAVLFPNAKVPIGQRALLLVKPIKT
ncbi:MAG: succinylglutamate desuccinylase [Thalassotalea sp.]